MVRSEVNRQVEDVRVAALIVAPARVIDALGVESTALSS